HGPFAGAFLAGSVEDFFDKRLAVGVLIRDDIAGDLDQITLQVALVPFLENLVHFIGRHAQAVLQDVVSLADDLHVAVFDAVVDHLDVMAGAVFANPIAAGRSVVHFGRDGLEDRFDVRPGRGRTAGHDARTVARPFLPARHTGAD